MFYNKLFQKVIFPLSEFVNGSSIQKKLEFLNNSQYWSKEKIEKYQNERLKILIKHSYENVPYYKKLFDSLKLKPSDIKTKEDLKRLPILTKDIVKKNTEDLRARNYLNKSFAKYTSGSTGQPTKFYQTKEDFSWIWSAHFRAWTWAGFQLGDKYVKVSLNRRYKLVKRIQDKFMRCLYIYSYQMSNAQIKNYINKIIRFKPPFIYGYSSSLNVIANYMQEKGIHYDARAIITTGDNLLPRFRKTIETQFGAKIYDGYGCGGEGLNIAAQCSEGTYHINDELLITELVGKEIVLTSLNNFAMPLIRYKPNDLVIAGNRCKCGKKLAALNRIDGRSHDVIITPKGDILIIHFFTALFEYMEGIDKFKIIQNDLKGIIVRILKNSKYNTIKDEEKIRKYIRNSVGSNFNINFEYVNEIPFEKSGKIRFIESRLK